MFGLWETSSSGDKIPLSFDFCASTVNDGGTSTSHASGNVRIVTLCQGVEARKLPREPMGERYNAKSWYRALATAGVKFGPSFQTLSDIKLVKAHNEAVAKIALHTTKLAMPNQSQYPAHPTTLDGVLQLSVMAAQVNDKIGIKVCLPVSIDEFTLWPPANIRLSSGTATMHGRGQPHGLRSVVGTSEVFDDDGRLFITGRFSFLSIEGGLKKADQTTSRKPYCRLIWKPDVERLGRLHRQNLHFENSTHLPSLHLQQIDDYLELLAHKGLPARVGYLGRASFEHFRSEGAEAPNIKFDNLDMKSDIHADPQTYDLVVLSDVRQNTISYECFTDHEQVADENCITIDYLRKCNQFLKSGGKLIIDVNCWNLLGLTTWSKYLSEAAFGEASTSQIHSSAIKVFEPQLQVPQQVVGMETYLVSLQPIVHCEAY